MTLPLGAIAKLLHKQFDKKDIEVLKSLNNLYQSLVDLSDCFFFNEECKYSILNLRSPSSGYCRKLRVNIDDTEPKKYFGCQRSDCARYMIRFINCCKAICPNCFRTMDQEISVNNNDIVCEGGGVFVSDHSTFIVTDDLRVMPYTSGCCIKLLIGLKVTDMSHIEEITFVLGYQQILDLLRLSLTCNSPLTCLLLYPPLDLVTTQHGIFDLCKLTEEKEECKMFIRVCLQKSTGKVLFAEAEEDFVDFLSGFLAISLGTFIGHLMKGNSSLVCMDNIYKSISDISQQRYFSAPTGKVYRKAYERLYSKNGEWLSRNSPGKYVILNDPRLGEEMLKPSGMFMVTDDLIITPSSSISTITILSKSNVHIMTFNVTRLALV
ncbi:uncharacterized protein [Rutidosis leptorrhynchoides]|uniref:uncharacterized protein n=1 Tax=Rutidosis leptorrhynchoides TaxID=125765 RepID=UPI003A9A2D9C